jgi:hypothetical protein
MRLPELPFASTLLCCGIPLASQPACLDADLEAVLDA